MTTLATEGSPNVNHDPLCLTYVTRPSWRDVRCAPQGPASLHAHPNVELAWVLEGSWHWRVDASPSVKRAAGELVVLGPEQVHLDWGCGRVAWLGLTPSSSSVLAAVTGSTSYRICGGQARELDAIVEIASAAKDCGETTQLALRGLAFRLELLLRRLRQASWSERVPQSTHPSASRVRAAAAELARPERESIARVARRHGFSERHFRRVFREVMGLAPRCFARDAVLNGVRDVLLQERKLPLKALADRFAFADAAHLCRAFKARYGLSPRQFLGRAEGGAEDDVDGASVTAG